MKHLIVLILISILSFEWGGSTHAQDPSVSPRVQQELDAKLARRKTEIQKLRAVCADKLDIPIVPYDTEELVARDGLDKTKAFNDCMINESGVLWSIGRALLERKSVR